MPIARFYAAPGALVAILSTLAAWLVFMPAHQAISEKIAALIAFGVASLLLVAVVAALNWALDQLLFEVEHRRNGDLAKSRLAAIVEWSEDAGRGPLQSTARAAAA